MSGRTGTIRLFSVALLALLVGIVVGYTLLPRPTAARPSINLSASSVSAGAEYTVKFSGFPAKTEIYGWVVNENPPRTFDVGTTDAQGELEVKTFAPQTRGTWLVCASDEDYSYWATAVLTVT